MQYQNSDLWGFHDAQRQEHPCAAGSKPQASIRDMTTLWWDLDGTPRVGSVLRQQTPQGLPRQGGTCPGAVSPLPGTGHICHIPVQSPLLQGCPGAQGGLSDTQEHAGRKKATLAPRAEQYHIFTVKNMPRTQAERQHREQLTQQTFQPTKPCFSIQTWSVPALLNTTRML